jgi:uncharacterized membrane protein (DUF106 family)
MNLSLLIPLLLNFIIIVAIIKLSINRVKKFFHTVTKKNGGMDEMQRKMDEMQHRMDEMQRKMDEMQNDR